MLTELSAKARAWIFFNKLTNVGIPKKQIEACLATPSIRVPLAIQKMVHNRLLTATLKFEKHFDAIMDALFETRQVGSDFCRVFALAVSLMHIDI